MSVQAISWVLEHSETRLAARLVMIGIANHVDARGDGWAYVSEVMRAAAVSEDSYHRAIRSAMSMGELDIDVKGGGALKMRDGYRPNRFIFPKLISGPSPLQIAEDSGTDPAGVGGTDPAGVGGTDPAGVGDPQDAGVLREEPSDTRLPPEDLGDLSAKAKAVVDAVYEQRNPRPATDPSTARELAETFLDLGYGVTHVQAAMLKATTLTIAAIEHQLRTANHGATSGVPTPLDGIVAAQRARIERNRRPECDSCGRTGMVEGSDGLCRPCGACLRLAPAKAV